MNKQLWSGAKWVEAHYIRDIRQQARLCNSPNNSTYHHITSRHQKCWWSSSGWKQVGNSSKLLFIQQKYQPMYMPFLQRWLNASTVLSKMLFNKVSEKVNHWGMQSSNNLWTAEGNIITWEDMTCIRQVKLYHMWHHIPPLSIWSSSHRLVPW